VLSKENVQNNGETLPIYFKKETEKFGDFLNYGEALPNFSQK